ncbi:MAG: hypothetical protein RL328_1448 [Acidobacteriota bacterium]
MLLLASAVALIALTVAFTFLVRTTDIPQTEPTSPVSHLEERRAAIYENLRDLQFEYRVGKLSDADYQASKDSLQRELAGVLAEMDRITGHVTPKKRKEQKAEPAPVAPKTDMANTCPHCGARFSSTMKFCGECGKEMVL